jgi:hypothetical protein
MTSSIVFGRSRSASGAAGECVSNRLPVLINRVALIG